MGTVNPSRGGLQLSVIIATHNRAKQLEQVLKSLSQQSIPMDSFEVVVVNNGSSEPANAIVQNYIERWSHWKLLEETKPGAAAARNTGIRVSRAPLVLFLDDDIVADQELVEQHLRSHRNRPGVAVLGAV